MTFRAAFAVAGVVLCLSPAVIAHADPEEAQLCTCPHWGDYGPEGGTTIVDVVQAIEVTMGRAAPLGDVNCPVPRLDMNCDTKVDALDVHALFAWVMDGTAFPCTNPCACQENPADCGPTPLVSSGGAVTIESKAAAPRGTGVQIGVFLDFPVPMVSASIPLEIRSIDPGAFVTRTPAKKTIPTSSRLYTYGTSVIARYAPSPVGQACSGPTSGSYENPGTSMGDSTSPDGLIVFITSPGSSINPPLPAGADPAGTENASLILTLDVNSTPGIFIIDTCCAKPDFHLRFYDAADNIIIPQFTPGYVQIDPSVCECDCLSDIDCDGFLMTPDVVHVINLAFRGSAIGAHPRCSYANGDVNCSGAIDATDVVAAIDVVMRGADPATVFCSPCPN